MAKYTGPRTKIARKFGDPIYGPDRSFEKKNYPPGQHGVNKKRKKLSEYGIQLKEKQKAKYTYGILERQFSNLFKKASRMKGVTGEVLLQLLESRLDNVVYRMGIAPSRAAARQLVSHRHITVDQQIVNIPSFHLKGGEVIGIREKSKSLPVISDALTSQRHSNYPWLEWDQDLLTGKFLNTPQREEIPENIKEQLIVELYSK
jgi:small subunit ribosomal protein S4